MFLGNIEIANLVNTKAQLIRKHRFWWLIGLAILTILGISQYHYTHVFYSQHMQQLEKSIDKLVATEKNFVQSIDNITKVLPQQNEHKHTKLSLLLRLLQKHMTKDTRLTTIEWQSIMRIEGMSLRKDSILPLRTALLKYSYFSNITLEQIRNQDNAYSFVLIVEFSRQLDIHSL